jgi:hypothetical protein
MRVEPLVSVNLVAQLLAIPFLRAEVELMQLFRTVMSDKHARIGRVAWLTFD